MSETYKTLTDLFTRIDKIPEEVKLTLIELAREQDLLDKDEDDDLDDYRELLNNYV